MQSNVRTSSNTHFQDVRLISFDPKHSHWNPGDILMLRPRNSAEKVNELFNIFREHNLAIYPETVVTINAFDSGKIVKKKKNNASVYIYIY